MKPDADVRAIVAGSLTAGIVPAEAERLFAAELRRQAAPYWEHRPEGTWTEVRVCADCGVRDLMRCPRRAEGDDRSGGCSNRRPEVTLRAWDTNTGHEQHSGEVNDMIAHEPRAASATERERVTLPAQQGQARMPGME